MNSLARQAQKMQEEMERITAELDEKEYTASAGGNAVSVVINGALEIKSIDMQPEVVDLEEREMLGDLIVAALNEAFRQANEEKQEKLGPLTNGLTIPGLF
jgi:DNA-binding YbaB/EbfC family protein